MTIQQGFNLIDNIVNNISPFGQSYLVGLILLILALVIVSRKIENWSHLAFQIYLGFYIIGVKVSLVFMIVLGIACSLNLMYTSGFMHELGIRRKTEIRETSKETAKSRLKEKKIREIRNKLEGKQSLYEKAKSKVKSSIYKLTPISYRQKKAKEMFEGFKREVKSAESDRKEERERLKELYRDNESMQYLRTWKR